MKKENRVAFFNILSTVLLRGIGILTGPLFSRLLGTAGYGVLNIFNIWANAGAIVLPMQSYATLVNARVEYPPEAQKGYQSAVMGLSLMSFLLLGVPVLLLRRQLAGLLGLEPVLIGLLLAQAFGSFCVNFLNTKFVYEFKAGRNMLLSLGISLASIGLSLALILNLPAEQAYFGRILGNALPHLAAGTVICGYVLYAGRRGWDRKYWRFCLVLAIPMVFYNLSDLLLGQIDQLMLQWLMGKDAVGIYGYALVFAGILFMIFGALNNTWCPFFFEDMKQGDLAALRRRACSFLELFTVLSVGFLLLGREVFHVFAGEKFWPGTGLIPIFTSSYYLNFLCTFPVNFEYFHKKTKVVAAVTVTCSLLNVGLNYLLILCMGMSGAAMATAVCHGVQLLLHCLYCHRLGKGSYPFPVKLWLGYAAAYFGTVALVYAAQELWLMRWGLGAAIGVWELLRIRKRKVLI